MTTRTLAALALAAVLGATATRGAADEPKLPDVKVYDKLVIDTLREVHNKGADLYNTAKDFAGAYRVYQGALVAVRPLLAHRPDAQKMIDAGLDAAEKEADAAKKAFLLHESIEGVRKYLKVAIGEKKADEPKKSDVPAKMPEEKKPDPTPVKKPEEKKPDPVPAKKPDEPKKPDPVPVAPVPKDGKPKEKDAPAAGAATASGMVTVAGKPLAEGEVTLISLTQPKPKVFTVTVKDGAYKLAEAIPAGKYAVAVTGKGVAEKYALANTSGLTTEFAAGANAFDIDLK